MQVSEAAGALSAFKQHWKIDFVTASAFLASLLNSPDAVYIYMCTQMYISIYT
jgi:hypothetical protein